MSFLQALTRRLRPAPKPDDSRWVVLDVESSGLDPKRDRLLAIAAIAVYTDGPRARVVPGDSFEVVLRQEVDIADKGNILLHGIGVGAQRQGVPPDTALTAFERFIGNSPLIAFHAAFDQTLILRAFDNVLGYRPADFDYVIEMIARDRVDVDHMITDVVKLDALPEAFEALRKPVTQCKVMLENA